MFVFYMPYYYDTVFAINSDHDTLTAMKSAGVYINYMSYKLRAVAGPNYTYVYYTNVLLI